MSTITGLTAARVQELLDGLSDEITALTTTVGTLESAMSTMLDDLSALGILVATNTGDIADLQTVVEGITTKTWREAIRFLVGGTVDAATVFPNAYIPLLAPQEIRIKEFRAKIETGTSIDVVLRRNGSGMSTLNNVGSAWSTESLDISLANADELDIVLSDPVGSPQNLAAIVVLEHVI